MPFDVGQVINRVRVRTRLLPPVEADLIQAEGRRAGPFTQLLQPAVDIDGPVTGALTFAPLGDPGYVGEANFRWLVVTALALGGVAGALLVAFGRKRCAA